MTKDEMDRIRGEIRVSVLQAAAYQKTVPQDAACAWIQPEPEPDDVGAKRAYEALVRARYTLIERDARLGEVMTRLTFREPADDPRKFLETDHPDGPRERVIETIIADRANFSYDPDFINLHQPDELLFILASMAYRIRADFLHEDENPGTRDMLTLNFAFDLISNAAIIARKIGRTPCGIVYDDRVTPDSTIDQAYEVAAEMIAQLQREQAAEHVL